MNKAANAYYQTKVNTTDQGQLLLMLYDGALRYLAQARDKILAKDYAAKGVLISKVMDIINELSGSLNLEKGGSLATNLNNLYVLCTARLLQANLKMNVESLDSVVQILSGLRSAYAQIIETPEAKAATAQIQSRIQNRTTAAKSSHAITQPGMTAPINRGHAQAAYGKSAVQQCAPKEPVPPQDVQKPALPRAHIQQFAPQAGSPINNRRLGAYAK